MGGVVKCNPIRWSLWSLIGKISCICNTISTRFLVVMKEVFAVMLVICSLLFQWLTRCCLGANACRCWICARLRPKDLNTQVPLARPVKSDNPICSEAALLSAMVIASYSEMFQITHKQIGRDQIIHLPVRNKIENIGSLYCRPQCCDHFEWETRNSHERKSFAPTAWWLMTSRTESTGGDINCVRWIKKRDLKSTPGFNWSSGSGAQ